MGKRTETKAKLTAQEIKTYKKCSKDIIEFTKYVRIFHPKMGWIRSYDHLFPKQRKVLANLSKNWQDDYSLILSARQSGKTTIILILVLWIITFNQAKVIGILSNKQSSARNTFRRFSQMYHKLPEYFKLSNEVGDSKVELDLDDGTLVFCGPTSKSGLRSESLSLLILDEFAWVQPGVDLDFWESNYPTIEQAGSLVVTSTPNGTDNVFYDLYEKSKDPKNKQWKLYEIWWHEVFSRGKKWQQKKIDDLSAKGKDGKSAFEREYNNSFEVGAEGVRFFNQESVGLFQRKPPYYEWVPKTDYNGLGVRVYEDIEEQHFLVGVDLSEGKGLNFSTMTGVAARKRNLNQKLDTHSFNLKQAFQYLRSDIIPDDFFNLVFQFLITELNDQWFLTFENNDIGRLWTVRLDGIFEELITGIHTKKNELFKNILIDKFESDKHDMIAYLSRRIYVSTGTKGITNFGIKTDRKNNIELKDNMKSYCDKRMVELADPNLLHEMRLYENKKTGGETVTHSGYEGKSHFDVVTSLKFALWPLHNSDAMSDVFNITPLKRGRKTRHQQILESIIKSHQNKSKKKQMEEILKEDNIRQLDPDGVPLEYRGVKDSTKGWKRGRYRSLWFKK